MVSMNPYEMPPICSVQDYGDEPLKMRSGQLFWPFHPTLRLDRERCSTLLHSLNDMATNGSGLEIQQKIFQGFVLLRPSGPCSQLASIRASLSHNVTVQLPFHCDYGYNMTIGSHVSIGPDTWIHDAAAVIIQDHIKIGSNVRLNCVLYDKDPSSRRTPIKKTRARPIMIEENVIIGSGALILGGVRIGRNSYVWPNSVIQEV